MQELNELMARIRRQTDELSQTESAELGLRGWSFAFTEAEDGNYLQYRWVSFMRPGEEYCADYLTEEEYDWIEQFRRTRDIHMAEVLEGTFEFLREKESVIRLALISEGLTEVVNPPWEQ